MIDVPRMPLAIRLVSSDLWHHKRFAILTPQQWIGLVGQVADKLLLMWIERDPGAQDRRRRAKVNTVGAQMLAATLKKRPAVPGFHGPVPGQLRAGLAGRAGRKSNAVRDGQAVRALRLGDDLALWRDDH
jgi:hypothetical protein